MNPDCIACVEGHLHTEKEWENHPMRGQGYTRESGWSHPDAEAAHDADVAALAARDLDAQKVLEAV